MALKDHAVCDWGEGNLRMFSTDCGVLFSLFAEEGLNWDERAPLVTGFKFCCYCAKPINEIRMGVDIDAVHRMAA